MDRCLIWPRDICFGCFLSSVGRNLRRLFVTPSFFSRLVCCLSTLAGPPQGTTGKFNHARTRGVKKRHGKSRFCELCREFMKIKSDKNETRTTNKRKLQPTVGCRRGRRALSFRHFSKITPSEDAKTSVSTRSVVLYLNVGFYTKNHELAAGPADVSVVHSRVWLWNLSHPPLPFLFSLLLLLSGLSVFFLV